MSRLNIAPPAAPRPARLDLKVPETTEAPENLSKPTDGGQTVYQDLNFKVDPQFHRRFKLEALLRGLSMKSMLEACFTSYLEAHGGTKERPRQDLI